MQLRAIVYAGIIHGATGITYYAWDSNITRFGIAPEPYERIPGRPAAKPLECIAARALWETSAQINRELYELTPVIYAPTMGPDLGCRVDVEGDVITDNPVRALLKPHPDGGIVLLTVNLDNAVLKATFTFERLLNRIHVLFENRDPQDVASGQKMVTEEYEPFDVHVFRLVFAEQ
jgi:hypothetical protein